MKAVRFAALLAAGLVAPLVAAQNPGVQFSADTTISAPQQDARQGRIHVGEGKMRTEMIINDKRLVQIMDIENRVSYMINDAERTFIRRPAGPDPLPGEVGQAQSPCAGMPGVTCREVGEETIHGRATVKWELVNQSAGSDQEVYYWVDRERNIPLRQLLPDGSMMEMQLVGRESLQGRVAEKWKLTATRKGGDEQVTLQWYDPGLGMNIREEQPGGMVREITNIRVAPQPASLFVVPDGYRELELQPGQP